MDEAVVAAESVAGFDEVDDRRGPPYAQRLLRQLGNSEDREPDFYMALSEYAHRAVILRFTTKNGDLVMGLLVPASVVELLLEEDGTCDAEGFDRVATAFADALGAESCEIEEV
ncbi:MAG: hypothetical protein JNL79_29115 [Myxococcales bacterium]|nr:hypothetical protein [Myxococcales bacterium]